MIAGFDLGQKCGYAILHQDGTRAESGTWLLGKRSGRSMSEFETLLKELLLSYPIKTVSYERVRTHKGIEAAHAYGAYKALLQKVCFEIGITDKQIIETTVQQIKRCATGDPRAEKEDMEAEAFLHWNHVTEDDNEADALWCAEVARRSLLGEDI